MDARPSRDLLDGQGGKLPERRFDPRGGHAVPVDERRILLREPEVERGERRHRAGDPDPRARLQIPRKPVGEHLARTEHASDLALTRRIAREEPLGQPDAPEVEARLVLDSSGPPAMSSVEPPPTSTTTVPAGIERPAATPPEGRSASSSPVRSRVANP